MGRFWGNSEKNKGSAALIQRELESVRQQPEVDSRPVDELSILMDLINNKLLKNITYVSSKTSHPSAVSDFFSEQSDKNPYMFNRLPSVLYEDANDIQSFALEHSNIILNANSIATTLWEFTLDHQTLGLVNQQIKDGKTSQSTYPRITAIKGRLFKLVADRDRKVVDDFSRRWYAEHINKFQRDLLTQSLIMAQYVSEKAKLKNQKALLSVLREPDMQPIDSEAVRFNRALLPNQVTGQLLRKATGDIAETMFSIELGQELSRIDEILSTISLINSAIVQNKLTLDSSKNQDMEPYLNAIVAVYGKIDEYTSVLNSTEYNRAQKEAAKLLLTKYKTLQSKLSTVQADDKQARVLKEQAVRDPSFRIGEDYVGKIDTESGRLVLTRRRKAVGAAAALTATASSLISQQAAADTGLNSSVVVDMSAYETIDLTSGSKVAATKPNEEANFIAGDAIDLPSGLDHETPPDYGTDITSTVMSGDIDLASSNSKKSAVEIGYKSLSSSETYARYSEVDGGSYQIQVLKLIEHIESILEQRGDKILASDKKIILSQLASARLIVMKPSVMANEKSAVFQPKQYLGAHMVAADEATARLIRETLASHRIGSVYTAEQTRAIEELVASAHVLSYRDRVAELAAAAEAQAQASNPDQTPTSSGVEIDNTDGESEFDSGNYRAIFMYYINQGISPAGASGILGNCGWESGCNPHKIQGGEISSEIPASVLGGKGGYGLFQITYPTRQEALIEYARETGRSTGDLSLQLDFSMKEMHERMPDLLTYLENTEDPAEAATRFMNVYENPGVPHQQERIGIAVNAYDANTTHKKIAAVKHGEKSNGSSTNGFSISSPVEYAMLKDPNVGKIVSETDDGINLPNSLGGVVYYSQWDKRWYNKPYNPPNVSGRDMAGSGCGPTTQAMAISSVTRKNVYPYQMAEWNQRHGYRIDGGTSHAAFVASAEAFGANAQMISNSADNINAALRAGKLVIVNGQDGAPDTPATTSGHIYLVRGIAPNGNFKVSDGNSISKSLRTFTPEEIASVSTVAVAVW